MPHAGLMDADALGPEAAALLRARLHVRGARRRLGQGRYALALAALYDGLTSGMDWFLSSPARRAGASLDGFPLSDDVPTHAALLRAKVLDGSFDFAAFRRAVYRALDEPPTAAECTEWFPGAEAVLTRLGVLPFDEAILPPEDPRTP